LPGYTRINNIEETLIDTAIDSKNKLLITIGDGISKSKLEGFFFGNIVRTASGSEYKIPGRDIFRQYINTDEGYAFVVDTLRESLKYRFRYMNVKEQLELAGKQICADITRFVMEDKVRPENGPVYKKLKDNKPVGVYSGELIESMEAVYVRES
jgi:hypothetical protein